MKQFNYLFQFNYWILAKGETIGAFSRFFGAAPSAPLMLIFSARRLRRRGGSFFRRGAFGVAETQQFACAASGACGSIAVKCLWQGGLICIRPLTGWMGKIRAAKGRGSCQSIGYSGEVGPHRIHTKPNNCSRLREGEMLQLIISH